MVGGCCFVAGILAPLLGGLLTVIEWIVGVAAHPWLHIAGTTLFVVGIPLILFAGFSLDWGEGGQTKRTHYPDGSQRGAAGLAQITICAFVLGVALLASPRFIPNRLSSTYPVPTRSIEATSLVCQSRAVEI